MAEQPRRIYFVAGEASGDGHGARLIRALKSLDSRLYLEGLGGVAMQEAGMSLDYDLASEGIMGFVEVLKHAPRMRRLLLETAKQLRTNPPDAVVLIDYPGFNIRLAKLLHGSGIPVVYYISPQVWAWKKGRIHTLAKVCRKMLVIFPFEEKLYRDIGMDCVYVGHPLLEEMQGESVGDGDGLPPRSCYVDSDPKHTASPEVFTRQQGELIGLLPGSRAQEIARLYPDMLDIARRLKTVHPELAFATPCTNELRAKQLRAIAGDFPVTIIPGAMHEVLRHARFCLVASGTATLETALFGVPMIILYRVSPLTYRLAKMLVDITHIGIVNVLAGRGIVPEYIQGDIRTERILPQALSLIEDTPAREIMLQDLHGVRELLGGGGASLRAAQEILTVMKTSDPQIS